MTSKFNAKYRVGDYVELDKIFTTKNGGSYDYSHGIIIVVITRVSFTHSLGYCYQLESPENIDLGGVMYWESDISRLVISAIDVEENMWKTWGDH